MAQKLSPIVRIRMSMYLQNIQDMYADDPSNISYNNIFDNHLTILLHQ